MTTRALMGCVWATAVAFLVLVSVAAADTQPQGHLTLDSPGSKTAPGVITFRGGYQGATTIEQHVAYAVDVSGSTETGGADCNGDGVFDERDDLNGDGEPATTLDCEIAGVAALNSSLRGRSTAIPAGLIAFGDEAARADMSPSDGEQAETDSDEDADGDRVPDVESVAASLSTGAVSRYTEHFVSSGTNFDAPLQQFHESLDEHVPGAAKAQNTLFFLSDGQASYPEDEVESIKALVASRSDLLMPVVNAVSVGDGAAGCETDSPLRQIADAFGGTCTEATPDALTATLADAKPLGLDHIDVTFSGTTVPATVDALGGWRAAFPDVKPNAAGIPYVVTAYRTDGSTDVLSGTVIVSAAGFKYVALGDSYSSGNGLVPYFLEAQDRGKQCARSQWASAFSVSLPGAARTIATDPADTLSFHACGGAQTIDLVEHPQNDSKPQIGYLDDSADLVTLTIGGNDANFSDVMRFCGVNVKAGVGVVLTPGGVRIVPKADTSKCQNRGYKALTSGRVLTLDEFAKVRLSLLQADELDALKKVRAAAPNATVLVADYPHLISQDGPSRCLEFAAFTSDERRWIRSAGDQLNSVIAQDARQAGVFGVKVAGDFAAHEKCGGGQDWMYGFEFSVKSNGDDDENCGELKLGKGIFTYHQTYCQYGRSFHPRREGTAAYGQAYTRKLVTLAAAPPNGVTRAGLPRNPEPVAVRASAARGERAVASAALETGGLSSADLEDLRGFTSGAASAADVAMVQDAATPAVCGADLQALPGQLIAIDAAGFKPGTPVAVTVNVHGQQLPVTRAIADASGLAGASALLPKELGSEATVLFSVDGTGENGFEHRATASLANGASNRPCVTAQRKAGLLSRDGRRLPRRAGKAAWHDTVRPRALKRCTARRRVAVRLPHRFHRGAVRVRVTLRSGPRGVVVAKRNVSLRKTRKRRTVAIPGLASGRFTAKIAIRSAGRKRTRTVTRSFRSCARRITIAR